ncbi:MAG: hypothetical protein ACREJ3_17525 [Polyangiaceae bacterium]
MPRASLLPLTVLGLALALGGSGCKSSKRARVTAFVPPVTPAGFVYKSGPEWRAAVPSTWKEATRREPAAWIVADPQEVDGFQASVNVLTEPFAGESYDYAKASEAALRRDPRATVESVREAVVDGDPTLIIETRWEGNPPSGAPYRTTQTALASRGKGTMLTCAAAVTAAERYRSTCESIMHSFAVER